MTTIFCATLSKNQGKFLESCLKSIHCQAHLDKHVVYDLASRDETSKLLTAYSSKIEIIVRESDRGPSDGLNTCAELNDSDIFCYLNADDVFAQNAFNFVVRFFQNNPNVDILHGSIFLIDEKGTRMKLLLSERFTLKRYALRASIVNQQATFVRSRVLPRNPFSLENRISWDGELIVDLVKAGATIKNVHQVLGYFRTHNSSITSSRDYKSRVHQHHKIIEEKILGREATRVERSFGFVMAKILALKRKIMITVVPETYFTKLGK